MCFVFIHSLIFDLLNVILSLYDSAQAIQLETRQFIVIWSMASKIYVDYHCQLSCSRLKASDSDAEDSKRTRTMKISNLFREKDMESHLIMVNYNNHIFKFHFN